MDFKELVNKVGLVDAIIIGFAKLTPDERKWAFGQLKPIDWLKLIPKLAMEPDVRAIVMEKANELGEDAQKWLKMLLDRVIHARPTKVEFTPEELQNMDLGFAGWLDVFLDKDSDEPAKAVAIKKMADCADTPEEWSLVWKYAANGSMEKKKAQVELAKSMTGSK